MGNVNNDKRTDEDTNLNDLLKNNLILWNDDHNSIDNVIGLLVMFADHSAEQAEQCAMIAHMKGRCTIQSGPMEELRVTKDSLSLAGLGVTIE